MRSPSVGSLLLLVLLASPAFAQVRERAVVDLTFDEENGPANDAASVGSVKDVGTLAAGTARVVSPFWNHTDGRAVRIEEARKQYVTITDGADVDRGEAVSVALFAVNLEAPADAGYHGLFAKRRAAEPQLTNYGINFNPKSDLLQLYVHTGGGFKVVQYSVKRDLGYRRLVHLVATWELADAPGADADEDRDDLRVRLFVNGAIAKPRAAAQGLVDGNDGWITDIDPAKLANDTPFVLGATNATQEHTDCVLDEVQVFAEALSPEDARTLFLEVAGANGPELAKRESAPATPAAAPVPEITSIDPPAFGRDATRITIGGKNLAGARLLLPEGCTQKVVENTNPGRLVVELSHTLEAERTFGLRAATEHGASNVRPIVATTLPVAALGSATAESPATLPRALHGVLSGSQTLRAHVVGRAGETIVADVETRRIGGGCDPVLEIKTARGTPIAIEWAKVALRGDTRAIATLPADGTYLVELHDLAYRAPGRNPFVLRVGTGVAGERHEPDPDGVRVVEDVTDAGPQHVETPFAKAKHVPVVVRGTIAERSERDVYLLDVPPGTSLEIRVLGRAIDSPIDAVVAVLDGPDGRELARSEDQGANRDPRLVYGVPGDRKQVAIAVSDLHGHAGASFRYDLRVVPNGRPDFALTVEDASLRLPRDGSAVLRLKVERRGYNGPIPLAVAGSSGITVEPNVIPAGLAGSTFVTVRRDPAGPTVPETGSTEIVSLVGRTEGLTPPIERTAVVPAGPNGVHVGGSDRGLPVTTTGPAPVNVAVDATPAAYFKGALVRPNVVVTRPDELAHGAVRLTLVTNEPPRLKNPKDAKQGNKPLVRATGDALLEPGTPGGPLPIAVPLDVAVGEITAVVRAEVVRHAYSGDVLATAYSAPFRLAVRPAVTVMVDQASLKFVPNTPTTIRGSVTRTEGFAAPVVIDALGLPAGFTSQPFTLPPGETTFAVPVTPPAAGTKVDPKAKPDPKLRLRSEGREILPRVGLKVTVEG